MNLSVRFPLDEAPLSKVKRRITGPNKKESLTDRFSLIKDVSKPSWCTSDTETMFEDLRRYCRFILLANFNVNSVSGTVAYILGPRVRSIDRIFAKARLVYPQIRLGQTQYLHQIEGTKMVSKGKKRS